MILDYSGCHRVFKEKHEQRVGQKDTTVTLQEPSDYLLSHFHKTKDTDLTSLIIWFLLVTSSSIPVVTD